MRNTVTTIKRTAPDTYTATIDGLECSNITPPVFLYAIVMAAITAGEPVVDAPTQGPFAASAEL